MQNSMTSVMAKLMVRVP